MHTGDRFADPHCKCMDCARARQVRAEARARFRDGASWRVLETAIDSADRDLEALTRLKAELETRRRVLVESARKALAEEDNR